MQLKLKSIVILSLITIASTKFLAEKPDFLHPCKLADTKFGHCLAKNFEAIFHEWKQGVPGLESVGGLDPLFVKRVLISNDLNQPVSIHANLHNVEIAGLGTTTIKDIKLDLEKRNSKFFMTIPKIKMNANYDVKGRVLNLALNSNGSCFINVENMEVVILTRYKIRQESGFIFNDIDKLRMDIKDIGQFHIRLDNLFHGQRVLEESANAVFNENWHEFFEILRPAITSAIEAVMYDRLSKILSYVPVTYLVEDFPTDLH